VQQVAPVGADPRDERIYRSKQRQLLIAASILAAYIATFSVVLEPDPVSHTKVDPSKYLWQVIPFAFLTMFLGWRAMRVRLVSTADGLAVHRVASREFLPWSTITGFEIHESSTGWMASVVARRINGRTVRLANYWVGRRRASSGDPPAAVALRIELADDLATRLGH
jgi:hypothetical protein